MSKENTFVTDLMSFNSHVTAKDKLFRTLQYSSRLIIWYLEKHNKSTELLTNIKNLEASVSLSRKLFRMATSADFLQKALNTLNQPDDVLRSASFVGMLFKSLWLFCDHFLWIGKVKVSKVDTAWWSRYAYRCWLVGILALILRDVRKLQLLAIQAQHLKQLGAVNEEKRKLKGEMESAQLELAKDVCDVCIPLAGMDIANKGLAAAAGTISSLIGFSQEWQKHVISKKQPSPVVSCNTSLTGLLPDEHKKPPDECL